jgi:Excreted virulence factor EspC, type VII ESX diderm
MTGSGYNADGSGKGNDYATTKNYDSDGGAATTPPAVASWQVQDPSKVLHVKPDVLNQVADALQQDITNAQSVLQQLEGLGPQLQAAMGQWPTGQSFGYMVQDALTQVTQIHQQLIQAHSALVQRLQTTAVQYGDAEATNTATVNTTGQQVPMSSRIQAS